MGVWGGAGPGRPPASPQWPPPKARPLRTVQSHTRELAALGRRGHLAGAPGGLWRPRRLRGHPEEAGQLSGHIWQHMSSESRCWFFVSSESLGWEVPACGRHHESRHRGIVASEALLPVEGVAEPRLLVHTAGDHSEGRKAEPGQAWAAAARSFPRDGEARGGGGHRAVVQVTSQTVSPPPPSWSHRPISPASPAPLGLPAPTQASTPATAAAVRGENGLRPFCSGGRWPSVGFIFVFWLERADFI